MFKLAFCCFWGGLFAAYDPVWAILMIFVICHKLWHINYKRCTHTYSHTHMHACTHTRTVQTDRGDGQCCLAEIFGEEKCLEFAFEGRKSSRVPDVLGENVPDVGAKV